MKIVVMDNYHSVSWYLGTAGLPNPWSSSVVTFCDPKIDERESGPEWSLLHLSWHGAMWSGFGWGSETAHGPARVNHCGSIYRAPPMSWEAAAGQWGSSIEFGVQVSGISPQAFHLLSAWAWVIHFTDGPQFPFYKMVLFRRHWLSCRVLL